MFKLQNVIFMIGVYLLNIHTMEKRKTVLRTIRIDRDLDDALNKDARENDITENALISSILVKYIEWDRYAKKFGRVSLLNETLKSIIEATEPDKLEAAAKELQRQFPKVLSCFAIRN